MVTLAVRRFREGMHRQRGVGLIELMVAMALGALVVIGVIQVFTANRQTFRMQDAMSLTQESGTFAIDFISRDLARAGEDIEPAADDDITAFDWPNSSDGGAGNDVLAVVYDREATNGLFCNGEESSAGSTRISNRYWVNADNQLVCQGAEFNGVAFTLVGQPQVLVDNVESFQVLYGVDTAHPALPADCTAGVDPPTLYVRTTLVAAALARAKAACPVVPGQITQTSANASTVVRTVRVGLLVSTANPSGSVVPAGRTFTVLDRVVGAPQIDPTDGRLRRLFVSTVLVRSGVESVDL